MSASFNNVLFKFDNGLENDLSVYEYELYEESDIVNPNTPPYTIKPGLTPGTYLPPFKSGSGNSSVFAVPVTGSYIDTENNNIVVQKTFFGRVRSVDTSGNVSTWTSIVKTDPSTPLIDTQYVVSLSADKIKAGTIESAEIILGGANSEETIIKSLTYDTSNGAQGWFIRGDGHFSLGGPNGITYNNSTITIGSSVQVQANLSADSISVGLGQNQLNINDSIGPIIPGSSPPTNVGGMTLGDPSFNYWYADGKFSVGGATNYMTWNGNTLDVKGSITATTLTATQSGRIGPFAITADSLKSTSFNSQNYLEILNYGDILIYSAPLSGGHANMRHTTSLVGEYIVVGRNDLATSRYATMGSDNSSPGQVGFEIVENNVSTFRVKQDGALQSYSYRGNANVAGTGTASYHPSGIYSTGTNWLYGTLFLNGNNIGSTSQYGGAIYMNNWFRSSGSTGWYNETHGGGIYMDEGTTVKVYNNKQLYSGNNMFVQNGGTFAANTSFAVTGSSTTARLASGTLIAGFDALGRPSSLRELKENIQDIEDGLNILNSLRPRKYNFRADAFSSLDPNTGEPWTQEAKAFAVLDHKYGFIVDEVLEVRPDLISYSFENDGSENPNYLDFSKWKPTMWEDVDVLVLCVKAIQQLSAKVDELQSRLI